MYLIFFNTERCSWPLPERLDHLWLSYFHCSIPLLPYLQFLGRSLRMGRWRYLHRHRNSVQQCLPLHGLASHCPSLTYWNHSSNETTCRGDYVQSHQPWWCQCFNDCYWISGRTSLEWRQPWNSLDLLVRSNGSLFVHCPHPSRRPWRCYQLGEWSNCAQPHQGCSVVDSHLLVHVSFF